MKWTYFLKINLWKYVILFLLGGPCFAGSISIVSEIKLELKNKSGQMYLIGNYKLSNRGDSVAMDVYPQIAEPSVLHFSWRGDSVLLGPGSHHDWRIEEKLSANGELFAKYLFLFTNNYRDQQGYPFSAVTMEPISYHYSDKKLLANDNRSISLKIDEISREFVGSEIIYTLKYHVENLSDRMISVDVAGHLPHEFKLRTESVPLQIAPQSNVEGLIQWDGEKAVLGSQYAIFLYAHWAPPTGQGKGFYQWQDSTIHIGKKKAETIYFFSPDTGFMVFFLMAAWLGFVLLWLFWWRPLRRVYLKRS